MLYFVFSVFYTIFALSFHIIIYIKKLDERICNIRSQGGNRCTRGSDYQDTGRSQDKRISRRAGISCRYCGAVTVKRFTQKVVSPNQTTYVGKGKLEEIKEYIKNEEEEDREVGMVIFDDELSAKQIRNIEQELQVKILDRTSLILDIFAMRAQTAAAKTQVELAQYRYMLPRLQRLWTHLERQGGGSGSGGGKGSVGLRGPGETQLEMDRRIILGRMSLLKERLAEIDKQKTTQRKNRGRMVRVALVGYTNVGKSTIMNLLSKSEVFAENKLLPPSTPLYARWW